MPLPDYHGYSVLSIVFDAPTGETYTVLPVGDVIIRAIPYVPGGKSVIELVDGTRINAATDDKYHVDIEIQWREAGVIGWSRLVAWVKLAMTNRDKAMWFYPVANPALTAPDGVNAGVRVVPEFDKDLINIIYDDRIRQRSAKLSLKGQGLIASASLPSWIHTS